MAHSESKERKHRAEARATITFDGSLYTGAFKSNVEAIEKLWRRGFSNRDISADLAIDGLVTYMVASIINRCTPPGALEAAERAVQKQRRAQMLVRRREGATFAQVAAEFGVSPSRAGEMCSKAERDERNDKHARAGREKTEQLVAALLSGLIDGVPSAYVLPADCLAELGVRARNTLKNNNCEFVGDVATRTVEDLARTPNCGKSTLGQIAGEIESLGLRVGATEHRDAWRDLRAVLIERREAERWKDPTGATFLSMLLESLATHTLNSPR